MDKIDEIQAKIRKQEEELWDLEDDYKAAKKEIEETYIESIETLRKIVEAKDNYTLRTF